MLPAPKKKHIKENRMLMRKYMLHSYVSLHWSVSISHLTCKWSDVPGDGVEMMSDDTVDGWNPAPVDG